ncbi:MAG: binding-protein-dependent transporter inner rane component, partial [Chloroflexi bacterium]|nr:binding-protein-dependent transporter inner rane component [Chloroflexota bacterium]
GIAQTFHLGVLNQDLLGNGDTTLYTLIAIFGWSYLGIPLMLFDAGLSQISPELYEAAKIEGASGLQSMWHITVPMLRPTFMIVTMLAVIEALRAFDLVAVMTKGGPGTASDVLGYFMYITAFDETRFGYAASVSTVILLMSAVFAIFYLRRVGSDVIRVTE